MAKYHYLIIHDFLPFTVLTVQRLQLPSFTTSTVHDSYHPPFPRSRFPSFTASTVPAFHGVITDNCGCFSNTFSNSSIVIGREK